MNNIKPIQPPINRHSPSWLFEKQDISGIMINYYLDEHPISGVGVYAKEFIPSGTEVWQQTETCLQWDEHKALEH